MEDRVPPLTTEEIGTQVELKFLGLCAEGAIVANPVMRDVLGFDSMLQVRFDSSLIAHDLADPPLRALVQAKGTLRNKHRGIGITLSNWQRMISDPDPWFVFIGEIDGRACEHGYLVHVNEQWISKALRRLRSVTLEGDEQLNHLKMEVTYGEADAVSPLNGESLRTLLLKHVKAFGGTPSDYRKHKEAFYKNHGYEHGGWRGHVVLPSKDLATHYEDLSLQALGLREELPIESITVEDVRFGMPIQRFHSVGGGGTFVLRPNGQACKARVHVDGKTLTADATLYSTAINPSIPRDLTKIRVKLGPGNLCISQSTEGPYPLAEPP